MVLHPFERLHESTLRAAAASLFAAWSLYTVLLLSVVPLDHGPAACRARRRAERRAGLDDPLPLAPGLRSTAAFLFGFAGRALTWLMWVVTLLNMVENSALFERVPVRHVVGGAGCRSG
jgi:hypothetical protein